MKKYFPVYVRVPILFAIFFLAIEGMLQSEGEKPAFIEYPTVLLLLGLFLFALIAVEIVASATNKIIDRLMTPEERAIKEKSIPFSEIPWVKKLMQKLTKSKSLDQEEAITLDHEYDGIKELDNDLPPWWVGLFYVTALFALIYMLKYHVFDGDNQVVEFEKEMLAAKEQVEEYKRTAPDMLTAEQAVFSDDPAVLSAGKALFDTSCAVCHKVDGGGSIGPNLTDDHWILGGGMKVIFNTISEGGRPGQGMVSWKTNFKPSEIEKLASYVISLNGTTPEEGKAPEGNIIWSKAELTDSAVVEDSESEDEKEEAVIEIEVTE